MATPHDRFQVCHMEHGLVSSHQKLADALDAAQRWHAKQTGYINAPVVYDLMAHTGKPTLYNMNGDVLQRRTA